MTTERGASIGIEHMEEVMSDVHQSGPNLPTKAEKKGIGFGLFLLLAGGVLLAERLGWLPAGSDWLFPVILIAWGAGELYRRLT
jgi:hypothetical protein